MPTMLRGRAGEVGVEFAAIDDQRRSPTERTEALGQLAGAGLADGRLVENDQPSFSLLGRQRGFQRQLRTFLGKSMSVAANHRSEHHATTGAFCGARTAP